VWTCQVVAALCVDLCGCSSERPNQIERHFNCRPPAITEHLMVLSLDPQPNMAAGVAAHVH
jgi:hypothetical protein